MITKDPRSILEMEDGESLAQHDNRKRRERLEEEHTDPAEVMEADPMVVSVDALNDPDVRKKAKEHPHPVVSVSENPSLSERSVAQKWAEEIGGSVGA